MSQGYVFAFEFQLHDRLRKSMDVAKLPVQAMADALGVSRNTVGNYLSGRTVPNRGHLMVWSTVTNAPLEWIETGTVPRIGSVPAPAKDVDLDAKRCR